MSSLPCSTIRAGFWGVIGIVLVLLLVGFGLAMLTLGFGFTGEFGLVPRAVFVAVAGIAFLVAVLNLMAVFPRGGRLRVEVCEDVIEFHQRGRPPDLVRRDEIELVILVERRLEGVESFVVHGPGGSHLGTWYTSWFAKPALLALRVLKKHGYPCALQSPLHGNRLFYRSPGRRSEEG